MDELINKIILEEWKMFDKVKNVNGRASCQDDYNTFNIMRTSQFEAWDIPSRNSYYTDIIAAEKENRNLLTEKYAYMMQFTSPSEFESIKNYLPKISDEKAKLIEDITKIEIDCTMEMSQKYPLMASQGRPIHSYEDSQSTVSVETYMVGELKTYSLETLKHLFYHIQNLKEKGENISLMILKNMVVKYGYSSIDEAEERAKNHI